MPTIGRSDPKSDERRSSIEKRVLAGLEELLSQGATFTQLGVGQIANAAGISRSSFYLYFADKTELLVRLSASFKQGIFGLGRDWSPEDSSLELDEFIQLYQGVITHMRRHAGLLGAINEFAAHDPLVRASWTNGEELFVARMAQWVAAGNPHIDAQTAARVMVWGCEQVIIRQVLTGSAEDDAQVVAELAAAHWYGTIHRPVK